jgi:hypothetical protein
MVLSWNNLPSKFTFHKAVLHPQFINPCMKIVDLGMRQAAKFYNARLMNSQLVNEKRNQKRSHKLPL